MNWWMALFMVGGFGAGFLVGCADGYGVRRLAARLRRKPKQIIPLANVVQMSEWRKYDLPAVKRRNRSR